VNPRLHAFGSRRLPFPQSMEDQLSPLSLTARESWLLRQRVRMTDSPLRGGKPSPATLQVAPEALFPQGTQKTSVSHCTSLQESSPKSWNPSFSTESQPSTLLMLGGLSTTVHRNPMLPTVMVGQPLCPHQRVGTPAL
jgi:hypothetical protein